jgi:hypothetical protein
MAVYFIQSGDHIKIGKSNNPWKRFDSLQTGSPAPLKMLAIMPGDIETEEELHERFSELSVRGEWFRATSELIRFAAKVRREFPEAQQGPKKSPIVALKNTISKLSKGDDGDGWRFEIKRKPRKATRKNSGSTAGDDWYYWIVRVDESTGKSVYYGTLDVLQK